MIAGLASRLVRLAEFRVTSRAMTAHASSPSLPPGSTGWPLVGEALSFAADPFQFLSSRVAAHGPVVRSKILDKHLAILSGPDAAAAFIDEANVQREGGLPPHAAALFGAGVVNQVDGEAHRRRKRHLMSALDREALAHYLPDARRRLRARLAAWQAKGEVKLEEESGLATTEITFANFTGIEEPDATLSRFIAAYGDFAKALLGLPIAFPGTPLRRTQAFNEEMRARFAALAGERRKNPTGDGLSRLVASEVDGERLSDADVALEIQHALFAGGGLWSWFAHGARVLAQRADIAEPLRREASALPADPDGRAYAEADLVNRFVFEVKRTGLIIPMTAIGVARRDFVVGGHTIPRGWLVTWTTNASHNEANVSPYTRPREFDPARFSAERHENAAPHTFAPQGPGEALTSHRCAGVEYSTLILQIFFVELLRGPSFSLPAQDLGYDTSGMPARHKSGLCVAFAR